MNTEKETPRAERPNEAKPYPRSKQRERAKSLGNAPKPYPRSEQRERPRTLDNEPKSKFEQRERAKSLGKETSDPQKLDLRLFILKSKSAEALSCVDDIDSDSETDNEEASLSLR